MGFFDFLKQPDINQDIEEFKQYPDAILVDVRTPEEFNGGHIEGSINLPLQQIGQAASHIPNKNVKLYVYCHSGARSTQATAHLKQMGYTDVNNIGGISNYKGKVAR